jgi:transposase
MKKVTLLGIDIAKEIFQLHGVNESGKAVLKKKLKRAELLTFIVQLEPCLIIMEACGGSHYWAREFKKLGHEVKLISPQYVKPFVRGNKNDRNDAEAIVEAASRPRTRFVPINDEAEQDVRSVHRIRSRLVKERTALVNEIRGLLYEYGIFHAKGVIKIEKFLSEVNGDTENKLALTAMMRELCIEIYDELTQINKRIEKCDRKLEAIANTNVICQNLITIPGIGILGATILFTVLSDPAIFENGRHFAAYLGLVPRQHSSGGKDKLFGISKRGDTYIRSLLIHGGRSVVNHASKKNDGRSKWISKLYERSSYNCTAVAVANKNARVAWALAKNAIEYKADYKKAA